MTYADTGLTENTAYRYCVVAVVGGADVSSNEAVATTRYAAPENLLTVSTGSDKITLYFTQKIGAIGYNIYRGTTLAGVDYSNPVNTGISAPMLSYPGSDTLMFTDTGLTEGTAYFYSVKAIYPNEASSLVSLTSGVRASTLTG